MNLKLLSKSNIVVFGDVMLDRYVSGSVDRVSPEAPVPVLKPIKEEIRLGGAANVALNLSTLGSKVSLIGIYGKDSSSAQILKLLKKNKIKTEIFSGITSSQASLKKAQSNFFNNSNFCNLITGHKIIIKKNKEVDYSQICKNKGKIIIYMGIGQISLIVPKLISNGVNENEKVTLIEKASMKSEKLFFTTLKKCPGFIKKNNINSPSIIIIR